MCAKASTYICIMIAKALTKKLRARVIMVFKRAKASKVVSTGKAAKVSKKSSIGKKRINAENFRASLDGSFEEFRQTDAHRKLNPTPTGKAKKGMRPVLKKEEIEDSISKLAGLMK